MKTDLYTKVVLSVIALALVGILLKDTQPFQVARAGNSAGISRLNPTLSAEPISVKLIDQPIEIRIREIDNGSWWPIKIKCEDCK